MAIVFIPSLRHMIMVKLVTRACEHPDVLPFMYSDLNEDDLKQFCDNDRKMTLLPSLLKTRILFMLKNLRSEIQFWRYRYREVLCLGAVESFMEFSWRFDGTIDSLETAKAFIRNENMPLCCKFYLGCCHFLENYVLDMWERTPENRRLSLFHSYPLQILCIAYIYFLPWIISGGSAEFLAQRYKPNNLNDFTFFSHLWKGEVSLRCFVERLPMDIHIDWLKRIARASHLDQDLAHFVVSGSVRNQEIAVFREDALAALYIFLDWPLQIIFIDVAERLWNYLNNESFLQLLNSICDKINRTDFDYLELFREFWRKSPRSHKEYVIDILRNTDTNLRQRDSDFLISSVELGSLHLTSMDISATADSSIPSDL